MNHVFSVHLLFECRKLLLQHQNARALRVICVLWVVAIWVQLLKQSKLHINQNMDVLPRKVQLFRDLFYRTLRPRWHDQLVSGLMNH